MKDFHTVGERIRKLSSKHRLRIRSMVMVAGATAAVLSIGGVASASHSWNDYHWARQSNPFTVKLSSNLSSSWQPQLQLASSDWTASSVLDTIVVQGSKNPKTCQPTAGQVEVCNARYGRNGWLGLAQIWLNGSHIVQGTAKMNDTYFNLPQYNTAAEKNHVMCQEVGHTFGLGHQDESGASLKTCMDYADDSTDSQHPNAHDYELLEQIYAHLDSTTTVGTVSSPTLAGRDLGDANSKANWGRRVFVGQNGKVEVYERTFQDGSKVVSFVILADHS